MEYIYNDGGRLAAGKTKPARDCVCRAIAIASGLPYLEVWEALAEGNYTQRQSGGKAKKRSADHGVIDSRKWFKEYMRSLGFVWVPTMGIGTGCKVHLRENEIPMTGRVIANVSKHYTAIVDGVINDTHDCSRNGNRCVYGYYIFKPSNK